MQRSFLRLYNNELHHLRHMAAEFAREYPKIAGRLALDTEAKEGCPDPFVERLLEGFAFLTARVQLKLDAEFPQFTQSILETVYPHYLCPTPSMAVVRVEPNYKDAGTPQGFVIPRNSPMRNAPTDGETSCEFRTAHDVHLWPLKIAEAQYFTRDIAQVELPAAAHGKAAIRIRLQSTGGVKINTLLLDRLPVHVKGLENTPSSIFEQIFARCSHVVLKTSKANGDQCAILPPSTLRRLGLSEKEALLPYAPRGFEGHRLIQEYFALPQRFLFFEFTGLREHIKNFQGDQLDLILVMREAEPLLEHRVDATCFELFCTPVVNLFPKRLDPISLLDRFSEFHVVPDRTRPVDFEVYQIQEVVGHGSSSDETQVFQPFYLARDRDLESSAYYSGHRVPRTLSAKEKRVGASSSYVGGEVYISLVDAHSAPYSSNLQQLAVSALCTNRHLPIQMTTGIGKTDFELDLYAPVSSIRCLAGPTSPMPAQADGDAAWRVISQLSLNYLSLVNDASGHGAGALTEILKLYSDTHDARIQKQIEGIRNVSSSGIIRRIETPGPITFARGLEIAVEFDEDAFEGTGIFTLGSVIERFFARYVSLNSFTETVIKSTKRGEIIRWPAQPGRRQIV